MAYLDWLRWIMHDTPEARATKWRFYRKDLWKWRRLIYWWILCLAVAVAVSLMWRDVVLQGASVGLRMGLTVFVVVRYTMSILVWMWFAKPGQPRT